LNIIRKFKRPTFYVFTPVRTEAKGSFVYAGINFAHANENQNILYANKVVYGYNKK
jgi:hypothetical protein